MCAYSTIIPVDDLRLYSLARTIFEARLKAFGVSREGCFRRKRRLHVRPLSPAVGAADRRGTSLAAMSRMTSRTTDRCPTCTSSSSTVCFVGPLVLECIPGYW